MPPSQLAVFCASLAVACLLIGLGFALCGVWYVLPFSGLEMVAVGIALLAYCRHATDKERITLDVGGLVVEADDGSRHRVVRMNPVWVRVAAKSGDDTAVILRKRGREIVVARYVAERERR